jgi:hypothetical protein
MHDLGVSDLQLISYVPWVGFSKGLDPGTFQYVGTFIRATRRFYESMKDGARSLEYEQLLLRAGSIRTNWTSIEHLAAPKWMLGNFYLIRAISGPQLEWGDLRCAEAAFRSARLMLRSGGNPALLAAITNSQVILSLMKSPDVGNSQALCKHARARLGTALQLKSRATIADLEPSYWDPMRANMEALGGTVPEAKKARR